MKTYARIQDGRVAELLTAASDIRAAYHPSLLWVDVSSTTGIGVGWEYNGTYCTPPQMPPASQASPSIEELQSRLTLLGAQIAALRKPI